MNNKNLPKCRAVISFHETLPCYQTESLKKYLLDKYRADILFIGHPLLDIEESYQRTSRYEYYRNNRQIISKNAFHWNFAKPLLYVKDMIYTCLWCLKYKGVWDIFFGVDNISVLVALFLKRVGKVNKVIYHTIDYYPTRFQNKLLNWLYFQFDKICVRYADETWNVGSMMADARKRKMGRDFYDITYLMGITKPNLDYLKQKIGIGSLSELKEKLLERCKEVNFEEMAKDVAPFLFDARDAVRITKFKQYIEQWEVQT